VLFAATSHQDQVSVGTDLGHSPELFDLVRISFASR
jgi:hypothetical protein